MQRQNIAKPTRLSPLEPIEHIAAPDVPLPRASGQRRRAVDQVLAIDAQHAHLLHRTDKRHIPCALAQRKRVERDHGKRVLRHALIGW